MTTSLVLKQTVISHEADLCDWISYSHMDPISLSTDQCLLGCVPSVYSTILLKLGSQFNHHISGKCCCLFSRVSQPTGSIIVRDCRQCLRQDKTRQREVTDAGTTVPLSPHLQCRYSDDNIYFIQLKTLIDLPFRLGSLSNQT